MRRLLSFSTLMLFCTVAHAQTAPAAQVLTLGERFNFWFDNLEAVLGRFLDLPLFFLVVLSLIPAALAALLAARIARRSNRPWFFRAVITAGTVLLLLLLALVADRRNARLQEEIATLRATSSREMLASFTTAPSTPRFAATPSSTAHATSAAAPTTQPALARTELLFNLDTAYKELSTPFPKVILQPRIVNAAIDFVQIQCPNPTIKACLAIVNLRAPGVQIKLGTDLKTKTLTSAFARASHCILAINGEAGNSPGPNSGLGFWSGFLMQDGQLLLKESPGNPRPFLAFTRENTASFTPMSAPAPRTLPPSAYNVIWGRLDALVDGTVQTQEFRNLQPRTAMGISKEGSLLYLLVVDGRQNRVAEGFTRGEVGQTLKAFGAYQGMLCDEGGSSCMFLDPPGRIVNVPSDNFGQERITYTHFGIAFAPAH